MKTDSKLGVVIGVGNQKGGVGKTTNTVHLAAALGLRGYHCLIIDLDPAAGATKHLGVPENSFAGSLELLTGAETVENLAIADRLPVGVHLVPARPQLSELDTLLSKFVDRTRILEVPLANARQRHDFIFLDTAPAPGAVTTVATYSSAEWFLLSAFPHPLSLGGLSVIVTASAVSSSSLPTMAGMVSSPASLAARQRRHPARISHVSGCSGCGRTRIGCSTPLRLMLRASDFSELLLTGRRPLSVVGTSWSSGII